MTTEEAIKYFYGAVENKSVLSAAMSMDDAKVLDMVVRVYEANELALIALREKAERDNPKPLTIEELRQLDEEPVWVKPEGTTAGYGMWCEVIYNRLTRRVEALIPGVEHTWFEGDEYGETWTAYRRKPKEET